jgi:FkbM family methyltransferase
MNSQQLFLLKQIASYIPTRWRDRFLRQMYDPDSRQFDYIETTAPYLEGSLHVRTDSFIEWSVLLHGSYEPQTVSILKQHVKPDMICLDIGANIGCYTLALAWAVGPHGKVVAFEPRKEIFERLQKNCQLNHLSQVSLHNCGLSLHDGRKSLFIEEDHDCNRGKSSLVQIPNHALTKTTEVEIRHPESISDLTNLSRCDFIKIDTEGHEASILLALKEILQKFSPTILFEFHPGCWDAHQASIADTVKTLLQMGYRLTDLWRKQEIQLDNLPTLACDILAKRR